MPELFNAAQWLVDRHVDGGDGERVAVRAPSSSLTYEELAGSVRRVAAGLRALGVRPEERVLLAMADEVEPFVAILAVMRIGAVAVPSSTMLTGPELATLTADARARVVLGSAGFADRARAAAGASPDVTHLVLTGEDAAAPAGVQGLTWAQLLDRGAGADEPYPTWPESPALWLYTSGTTGTPKAAMHRHADLRTVAETYGAQVLGVRPDDVCLSVAKLFFAYGIGNSMFFPLAVGATTVLEPSRPTPARYAELAAAHGVTLFFGTPSFYGPLLASDVPDDAFATVRQGVSAGEALPSRMVTGVRDRFGVEVLDGIGSTEALHIFISNRPGQVVPGTSGVPVPGYGIELRDTDGSVITEVGRPGGLYVSGDSMAVGYWCRAETTRTVFQGDWARTGDTYVRNADGTYTCLGRADDMLKAGGIWVSPAEVEERLAQHPDVLEVAVVGVHDPEGLDKPVAAVVPVPGRSVDAEELVRFCRDGLASFKRPRLVLEVAELPRTATGKIQRFKVRQLVVDRIGTVPGAT